MAKKITGFIKLHIPAGKATPAPPVGHWEGTITLPTTVLEIRVDLERGADQSWQGTIDIPVQGLRGFKLSPVKVEGAAISFAMRGILGDPQFDGRLADDGKTITGDFTQSGGKFPFKLERKPLPAPVEGEPPVDRGDVRPPGHAAQNEVVHRDGPNSVMSDR